MQRHVLLKPMRRIPCAERDVGCHHFGGTAALELERPEAVERPDVDGAQSIVDLALSTFGRLDVMVNNAGIETRTSILETTEADYQKVLDVNLKSAFFGTQLAAKQFIAQGGGGTVLNISSVHEDWPMPGNVAYCVSKGGTRMLTRTAGVELGPHDIRVVNIAPGAVATPINQTTMSDPAKLKTIVAIKLKD